MRLQETGLIEHWTASYNYNIDKCLIKETKSFRDEIRNFTTMNFSHHVGTFLVIGIGISLSFVSFLCELIFFKMMKRH